MRSNSQHLFIDYENMKLGNNLSTHHHLNPHSYLEPTNSDLNKFVHNNECMNSEIFSANSDYHSYSEFQRKNSSISKIDFDCLSKKNQSIISTNNEYLPINLDKLELKSIDQSEYHQIINPNSRKKTLNVFGQGPSNQMYYNHQQLPINNLLNSSLHNSMKNDQNSIYSQNYSHLAHKSSFYEDSQKTNENFERRFSDIARMNYSSSKFINCKGTY